MTKYSWMIYTADEETAGPLGDVYLSLHGLNAATRELKLPIRTYEPGTVESGILEVRADLGELQTGSLRTQESERTQWAPDWIRIVNLSDGRQWTAQGGSCDPDGACPLFRFARTRGPLGRQPVKEELEDLPLDMERSDAGGNLTPEDAVPSEGSLVRTYEIFGTRGGRVVPLAEILRFRAGIKHLSPGGHVFVTAQASQGFGLGGEPGLWEDLYPGVDPAMYGLDSDKPILASDGARGWVVDTHYLAMIFGADWRRVVYGN